MHYPVEKITEIVGGEVQGSQFLGFVDSVSIDSRKPVHQNTLFVAIEGKHHDAHDFIPGLIKRGVRYFIVKATFDTKAFPESIFIKCQDPLQALQQLAAYHRGTFSFPLIAIVGSNGKTIVKEWLSQLFIMAGLHVAKSPKSYNSQVGVPLSVLSASGNEDIGVFEAGVSQEGEMKFLEQILQPDEVIFTNIGSAHAEGFESMDSKVMEKALMVGSNATLFYCKDHVSIDRVAPAERSVNWSLSEEASYNVEIETNALGSSIVVGNIKVDVSFNDKASLENVIHCLVYGIRHKINEETLIEWASLLKPLQMRLQVKDAQNSCKVIDDTYNNDLAGLDVAFEFMRQQHFGLSKTVVLSDFFQSGLNESDLYKKVAMSMRSWGISKIIGIGEQMVRNKSKFQEFQTCFYPSTDVFLKAQDFSLFDRELILVKGARDFKFERIVKLLERKIHRTTFEVNLTALEANLNYFREQVKPGIKIMVMVKAFAYGTGNAEVGQLLEYNKVDYLAVAYIDEGVFLRRKGINLPIMVMNVSPDDTALLLKYRLEPEIFSIRQLKALLNELQGESLAVHLKFDTGMHRLGFEQKDLNELCMILKSEPDLIIQSVFSHLAGADEAQFDEFTRHQGQLFLEMCQYVESELGRSFDRHILNSAGIVRFPHYQFDMVRLGIGLYGIGGDDATQRQLRSIGTLKTVVSQVKEIAPGETVGYARKGRVLKPKKIATIAIGYADGYSRKNSNGVGKVLVNGVQAAVIGNVCMDMTMIDVTGIKVEPGDQVIIYGENISIVEAAVAIKTIPYELLTSIGERVPRVYYAE